MTGINYGDGIYTSDSHVSTHPNYGPVCLLVARLKGATATVVSDLTYVSSGVTVLRSSAQCVPLLQFNVIRDDLLCQYHEKLEALVDLHFNDESDANAEPID